MEGDELYTRVHKKVGPDASQGWTVVLMDRATRFLWDMHCGRKDRKLFQKAMGLLCQVIEQTGDLTLLSAPANEDAQRRRCPKASQCGSRTKDHKGISAVPNGPSIKPRIPSIPTPHSLWPPQRFMRIIWKPSIPRCDDGVRPIAGAPICMRRRQDDSKKG